MVNDVKEKNQSSFHVPVEEDWLDKTEETAVTIA